ncbi:MFS general substrate transporter [Atractiella rhizophila]|nr:MFS general substrate transporter [Atractiella rhizophila]
MSGMENPLSNISSKSDDLQIVEGEDHLRNSHDNHSVDATREDKRKGHGMRGVQVLREAFQFEFREWTCFAVLAVAGLGDGSAGALIPYIQSYFHVSHSAVSLIFVTQTVGYLLASFSNNYLTDTLGMELVIVWGALQQSLSYALLVPSFHFSLLLVLNLFIGFGVCIQDSAASVYVGSRPNSKNAKWKISLLETCYGAGALVGPFLATLIVQSGARWSFFYIVQAAACAVNVGLLWASFRPKFKMGRGAKEGSGERKKEQEEEGDHLHKLKSTLRNKHVWSLSSFLLLMVGAEVSIAGWIVSFLIEERHGSSSAGYVATGFWSGVMLGRLLSPKLNGWIGEKKVVFYYISLAFSLEFVVWFLPNLPGNAIAVSFIGLLIGPMYPLALNVAFNRLPRALHAGSISFMTSMGQTGAAIFPFLTGTLAQRFSVNVLQPMMLVLFVLMAAAWTLVPAPRPSVRDPEAETDGECVQMEDSMAV